MMEDVELSSDEEEDNDDEVSLIVLKRPDLIKRVVQDVEVITPSGREGKSAEEGKFVAKERSGHVKEYIEEEGLGMIIDKELGLVLFHLSTVWLGGTLCTDPQRAKTSLCLGSEVSYVVRSFQGEDYGCISADRVLHQAVSLWTGLKPESVLRVSLGEEVTRKLEDHRKTFMLYVRGEVFMRASLVRVPAEVAGYISSKIGILEYTDEERRKKNIVFHEDSVLIYGKKIRHYRKSLKLLMPVGLGVTVDARSVHVSGVKNCQYQAIAVLAGEWPRISPFPTLFPGGSGSTAPKFEMPADHTFYYLELGLEKKMQGQVEQFKSVLEGCEGRISYDWHGVDYIRSRQDFREWKYEMSGRETGYGEKRSYGPREVLDTFKSAGLVEEEIPREQVRVVAREVESRTWYSPEAWEHGGLKLKEEVKTENEADGETASKRRKVDA